MSSLEGGGKSGPERVRGDAISCRMGEQRNGIRSRTWMDVRSAFAWGERQAQETPDKRFWLEKQRKVLFIIPLAPDHVALPVRNTAGMRIGDIVRYHLPISPQNKSRTGTLNVFTATHS
jgi:hypothetical protein